MFLSEGPCPTSGDITEVNAQVMNAFKVRTGGDLIYPAGDLTFVGFDVLPLAANTGDFRVTGNTAGLWAAAPYYWPWENKDTPPYEFASFIRDTDYDGRFEFRIAGNLAAREGILYESDADNTKDTDHPGIADGQGPEINYWIEDSNGAPMTITPEGNAEPTPRQFYRNG